LLITDGSSSGLAALAGDAFDAMGRVPGVVGPHSASAAFTAAWLPQAGGRGSLTMRQRLYKIERVDTGLAKIDGRLCEATSRDRDLALQWCTAFAREAVPNRPSDVAEMVDRHLKYRTLYFWDDGRPVTMCASPAGSSRINLVYTPPGLRRRGYATAAVAALSRQLLESGARYCCLYADLANPISNSIYQRIGYRPVCDFEEFEFAAQ
jgi:predicted GNAT family acetyltransferase